MQLTINFTTWNIINYPLANISSPVLNTSPPEIKETPVEIIVKDTIPSKTPVQDVQTPAEQGADAPQVEAPNTLTESPKITGFAIFSGKSAGSSIAFWGIILITIAAVITLFKKSPTKQQAYSDLQAYISRMRQKGRDSVYIQGILKEAGWRDEVIRRYL